MSLAAANPTFAERHLPVKSFPDFKRLLDAVAKRHVTTTKGWDTQTGKPAFIGDVYQGMADYLRIHALTRVDNKPALTTQTQREFKQVGWTYEFDKHAILHIRHKDALISAFVG